MLAIVGVMPLFSILCTAPVESPARSASWASDQPRSARAFATLAPISETVRSISGNCFGALTAKTESGDGAVGEGIAAAPCRRSAFTIVHGVRSGQHAANRHSDRWLDSHAGRALRIAYTMRYAAAGDPGASG